MLIIIPYLKYLVNIWQTFAQLLDRICPTRIGCLVPKLFRQLHVDQSCFFILFIKTYYCIVLLCVDLGTVIQFTIFFNDDTKSGRLSVMDFGLTDSCIVPLPVIRNHFKNLKPAIFGLSKIRFVFLKIPLASF